MGKISYTVLVLLSIKLEVLEAAIIAVLADTVGKVGGCIACFNDNTKYVLVFYSCSMLAYCYS
jgi:hypothetical protein